MEIRFGNFDVVAEDLVEPNFEGIDAGAKALAFLDGGDGLFAAAGETAKLVEFGVVAGANSARFVGQGGGIVGDRAGDEDADVGQIVKFGGEHGDFGGVLQGVGGEELADSWNLIEGFLKGEEFAGSDEGEGDAAGDASHVDEGLQDLAELIAGDGVGFEGGDGVETCFDFVD